MDTNISKYSSKSKKKSYKSKRLSMEEKLNLMTEYMVRTGRKIVANTRYKGYNLGAMKNNLRQMYYNGTLNINPELLEAFIKSGIITNKKERLERTSQQEKYEFFMQTIGMEKEELKNVKMKNGLSYYSAREQLQQDYNRGNITLTQEQIADLQKNGILNYSKEEEENLARKYEMPKRFAIDIERRWGSKENFIYEYKRNLCDYDFNGEIFCGYRGITISERDITELQKLNYALFVKKILGEEFEYGSGKYLDIDKLEEILHKCAGEEGSQEIKMYYGLSDGKKYSFRKIGSKYNVSDTTVISNIKRKLMVLKQWPNIDSIIGDINDDKDFERKIIELEKYNKAKEAYLYKEDIFSPDSVVTAIKKGENERSLFSRQIDSLYRNLSSSNFER